MHSIGYATCMRYLAARMQQGMADQQSKETERG